MSRENSGKAAAAAMTAKERKARAMKGVEAKRIRAEMPNSIYEGKLNIGNTVLDVAVLDNGTRVITQSAVFTALGRPSRGNARREDAPVFMDAKNLQPFISEELNNVAIKIDFIDKNNKIQSGYDAKILPLVADLYLKAREESVLHASQKDTAQKAEILVRSLAKVGIIALVDEVTGYQDAREKDALAKIFEKFVAEELQPWIKTFPDEYYKQLFRLYGYEYPNAKQKNFRPQFFGKVTNKVVYKKLAPEILPELKKQANKIGKKSTRLHQALTSDVGHPRLREHLASIVTLMKLSEDKDSFFKKVDLIHPDFSENYVIDLDD